MLSKKIIRMRRNGLNSAMFPSEVWFMKIMDEYQIGGYRRNFCLERRYFGDFVWRRHKLVVEIDGKDDLKKKEYDKKRDGFLVKKGWTVLRINAHDEIRAEKVIDQIRKLLFKQNYEAWKSGKWDNGPKPRKGKNSKPKKAKSLPSKKFTKREILAQAKLAAYLSKRPKKKGLILSK